MIKKVFLRHGYDRIIFVASGCNFDGLYHQIEKKYLTEQH